MLWESLAIIFLLEMCLCNSSSILLGLAKDTWITLWLLSFDLYGGEEASQPFIREFLKHFFHSLYFKSSHWWSCLPDICSEWLTETTKKMCQIKWVIYGRYTLKPLRQWAQSLFYQLLVSFGFDGLISHSNDRKLAYFLNSMLLM